ncbi:MAG TPA: hypothetical protein VNZ57_15840 [Longimicrobiales bacterium]|nr:hypothetical protein [Longimicrobiales bacterium]
MDRLFRIRIRPRGPWRTPWQADTIAGLLCWMCVRTEGETVLRKEIIEPMLAGEPPFVLSDAFPGDLLPTPLAVRMGDWPPSLRKTVKRAAWLRPEAFTRVCRGEPLSVDDLSTGYPIIESDQTRNTIDRAIDTTGAEGALFTLTEYLLASGTALREGLGELSIYARVHPAATDLLLGLFDELAAVGYGADAAVGKGAFDFPGGSAQLESVDSSIGSVSGQASSLVILSTFQPKSGDPARGYWESFVKFGKLGPGIAADVFEKHPIVLLRPGACFAVSAEAPAYLGRAIPMDEFLVPEVVRILRDRGTEVIHPAFGLAIPAHMRIE